MITMINQSKKVNAQGSALILAVVLVGVMSIGSAALWQYLHGTLREQSRNAQLDTAQHLAEAGLDKAVAMLRRDVAYATEQDTPLGDGTFSVAVERPAAAGAYLILATGKLGDEVVVRATRTLVGELPVDSTGTIETYHWTIHRE